MAARVTFGTGVLPRIRHAACFLLALGMTGKGCRNAGRRIHLVRAHCGPGIGIGCDHRDVGALLAQILDLAGQVIAPFRFPAQALELALPTVGRCVR
jgi:hypothetical protein